jgi:hypothetical protein
VFKQDQKPIKEYLDEASEEEKLKMLKEMEANNEITI